MNRNGAEGDRMGKRCERFCILDPGHDGACVPAEPLSWQATAERLQAEKLALRDQLRGAMEAGAALYACLHDGRSLGDEAVHDAMACWEASNPQPLGGGK